MKSIFYFLGILFSAFVMTAIAQNSVQDQQSSKNTRQFEVIDLSTDPKMSDGYIYVVGDKYYAANSYESLISKLKIKDRVESVRVTRAANPYSKERVDAFKKQLPEKYRNTLKGIITLNFRN